MPNVFWFLFFLKRRKGYKLFFLLFLSIMDFPLMLIVASSISKYCIASQVTGPIAKMVKCSTGIDYLITALANQISLLFIARKNRTPLKHEFMFQPHFYITTLLVLFTIFFKCEI